MKRHLIFTFFLLSPLSTWADGFSSEESVSVCVEWHATKTIAFLKDVDVVGRSCEALASVSLRPEKLNAKIEIPIGSFKSGNEKRDTVVQEFFVKNGAVGSLTFNLVNLSRIEGVPKAVVGDLIIGSNSTRIEFQKSDLSTQTASYSWNGKFSQLKLDPPRAVGGFIARVHDDLELRVEIPLEKINRFFKQSESSKQDK